MVQQLPATADLIVVKQQQQQQQAGLRSKMHRVLQPECFPAAAAKTSCTGYHKSPAGQAMLNTMSLFCRKFMSVSRSQLL